MRLQLQAGVHAGVRACAYNIWMYEYYIILLGRVHTTCLEVEPFRNRSSCPCSDLFHCGSVCAWDTGVRTCMHVCEHSNVDVYVCADGCADA